LLIDRSLSAVLRLAGRAVVLKKGRSAWTGSGAALGSEPRTRSGKGARPMAAETGITRYGESLDNIVWNILGQTYKPVQLSAASFAFDTLFPPGTFVPPHFHPDQDEFIRLLEGEFDLWLDGEDLKAGAGDLIRLPMGSKHGIFNKSNANTRALFWVAPSKGLYDLFVRINGVADPAEVVRIAAEHNIHFLPPPG
jgi:quercetin dioxygenase-like cupin family protein